MLAEPEAQMLELDFEDGAVRSVHDPEITGI